MKSWLSLVVLSLIWGTSFILIKKALVSFAPIEVAILRVGISGLAFFPFFLYHFKKLDLRRWPLYLLIALTGSGIPAILYATAQTQISSATSGILNSLTPIFTLLISIYIFKSPSTRRQIGGVLIGLVGALLLIFLDEPIQGDGNTQILYGALVVVGTILYAANVNMVKSFFQEVRPLHLSSFSFTLLGIPVLFLIPFTDIVPKLLNEPQAIVSLGYLSILALVSTFLAILIFYKLVQDTSPVFASSVAYIMPVVALAWGMFDGEVLGLFHLISLLLILYGVYRARTKGRVVIA